MSNIEIIGLDLDNTLYPSTPEIQKRIRTTIHKKISLVFDIELERAENLFENYYSELMSGSKTIEEIAEIFGKKDYPDIIQESLEEVDILDLIYSNPKLGDMLSRLKTKRELDLLTGSPKKLTLKKLKKLGIKYNTFENIFAHNNDLSKSTGDLYKLWISTRRKNPEYFLYIGDNPKQDIDVPKKLGIKTCFIGEKEYENADFNIRNILELENLFN